MSDKKPSWWVDESRGHPQFNPGQAPRVVVNVGCEQSVEIDKLYGPLIFASIRVRADSKTLEWVIERQQVDTMEWLPVVRVPGQNDDEFRESDAAMRDNQR